ncbi:MAG: class I SAM-dependent methyltransferase [Holosporaceae bacterium]|nr:MAG: class I SAM-dependent methyltransferase [Holosporaceae bacterium]
MAHKETPINPVQQTDYAHFLEVDVRSYWWNDDFLSLIFEKRHQVKDVKRALDVGCGIGHWTEKFAPYLHKNAEIHGLTFIKNGSTKQNSIFQKASTQKFHFQQGSAYKLPYPDEHFDFVTCQTLLMHLDQPKEAIKEMLRVLKKAVF